MKKKRGMKSCPNCKAGIGARTLLCHCGYHYPSQKVRKDLLEAKTAPKGPSAGAGKKFCAGCNEIIGARTQLCDHCGYHYPSGEVRQDLLDEKKKASVVQEVYYEEEGRGRKRCPGCEKIVGGRLEVCYCGFDFVSRKKEVDEMRAKAKAEKEKKKEESPKHIAPLTAEILAGLTPYEAPPEPTKKDHAERILSYGKLRAGSLLLQHRINKCWSHVDWDYVERKLAG